MEGKTEATKTRLLQFSSLLLGALVLLMSFVALTHRLRAQETDGPSVPRLASVTIFAFGGVGITGVTSAGEAEFQKIAAGSSAVADFEKVFTTGTPEAKAYALTGLFKFDRDKYSSLAASARNADASVSKMQGCIMSREKMTQILSEIERGSYELFLSNPYLKQAR